MKPSHFLLSDKSISCPHCSNEAPMRILARVEVTDSEDHPPYTTIIHYHTWYLYRCQTCFKVVLLHEFSNSENEDEFENAYGEIEVARDSFFETLFPPKRKVFQHVPDDVTESYEVATKLLRIEPVACAVFVGRTLEFLCKDRKAKGQSLDQMLRDLAARGEMPQSFLEMALNLKDFRNLGAHAAKLKLSRQDAELLLQICEVILEYVYESSQMLEAVKKRIAEVKAEADKE